MKQRLLKVLPKDFGLWRKYIVMSRYSVVGMHK